MADTAHQWTDSQIGELERRFRRTYRQASAEMREKLESFLESFDTENEEWKRALAANEVTKVH